MNRLLLSCFVVGAFTASAAFAHHTMPGRNHPTVQISQQVMVDGKPLPAGTYEIWVTNERPDVDAGAPSDAQRVVELAQNGQVIARTIAEVFPRGSRQEVGTSGTTGAVRARAEMLRGGEFLRVSFNDADGRYLLHFPTGPLNEPAPQPQSPSRIELPSQTPQATPNQSQPANQKQPESQGQPQNQNEPGNPDRPANQQ